MKKEIRPEDILFPDIITSISQETQPGKAMCCHNEYTHNTIPKTYSSTEYYRHLSIVRI